MSDNQPYLNHGQRVPLPNTGDEGKIVEKKTWTKKEINSMSSAEYATLLSNKTFVEAIDGKTEEQK
jgi:hypothetical protein